MTTATFTPDVVVCRLAATSKKQLLQQLSALAAAHAGLCDRKVLSAIISREKLGSTGIGNGLALPHAVLEPAKRPVTLLATLEQPVDFDSPDNMPVDVMALVLGTEDDSNGYLSTVNAMSRILHQRQVQLRDAKSDSDIRSALGEPQIVAA
ncbi:MAG: PTS sugar transporter subunit IIA [Alphaproteobacteria bacterium]|nr:PTS sugar transporter subunit IIA [Alphaproteobacteria bacterium]